ncbi:aldehyde dehydrogenase family protein [Rhodopirellula sp.]|nr:aldehyde dehydrogenase family protein [Rhodopirellula sp.]
MSNRSSSRLTHLSDAAIDRLFEELHSGVGFLRTTSLAQRISLVDRCADGVGVVARQWVEAACSAKRIPGDSPARAEEITAGPIATLRFLRLLSQSLRDIAHQGSPRLPGKIKRQHGQCRVPIFPTKKLHDSLLFWPMKAETWLDESVTEQNIFSDISEQFRTGTAEASIAVVLGAGNVSSIAATDMLSKILIENFSVALKMNPVNDYLTPYFETAFKPLIEANVLRIIHGDGELGERLVSHPCAQSIHVTGSNHTHDCIVWGQGAEATKRKQIHEPRLQKPITSELGNVSPWAIIPGRYSTAELRAQAETIASSIVNNASFNCIATKLIVTCRQWPQRRKFLDLLDSILATTPPRYAYYPGAADRFERFSGTPHVNREFLPWTLKRDIDPKLTPHLLGEESFTCVCGELALTSDNENDFLEQVLHVFNRDIWGTLAASLTLPTAFHRKHSQLLDETLRKLHYGTIGINQWTAISFALMSPPWGGFPGSNLQNIQSGLGFVHNTYLLNQPTKTILTAPLRMHPKPIWYSTHRQPEKVSWALLDLYHQPSPQKLPRLFWRAATG